MSDKLGIDQVLKVLDVVVEGGHVAYRLSKATGILAKLLTVVPLAKSLMGLLSMSPALLKSQYKDIDEAERLMLSQHLRRKFDISNDELEAQIELGLELVSDAVDFINRAVGYSNSFKKGK